MKIQYNEDEYSLLTNLRQVSNAFRNRQRNFLCHLAPTPNPCFSTYLEARPSNLMLPILFTINFDTELIHIHILECDFCNRNHFILGETLQYLVCVAVKRTNSIPNEFCLKLLILTHCPLM